MAEGESSGLDSVLKGLLGFAGGVAQRHLAGSILMSGLRGGVLGSRAGEAMPEDPNSGWGAYLSALTGLAPGQGWGPKAEAAPGAGLVNNDTVKAWMGGQSPSMQANLPAFMQNPMMMQAAMDAPTPGKNNPFGNPVFAKPVSVDNADPMAALSVLQDPEIQRLLARPKR